MELNLLTSPMFVTSLVYFTIQLVRRPSGINAARGPGRGLPLLDNLSEAALMLHALAGIATVAFRLIPPDALQGENSNPAADIRWPGSLGSIVLIILLELFRRALPVL